jgi:hypothetical protein
MRSEANDSIKGVFKIIIGLFVVFQGLWFMAYSSERLNLINVLPMLFAMGIPIGLIVLGARQLNRVRLLSDTKSRMLKYAMLTVTIAGFILMGIGVYILSIYTSGVTDSLPHPYQNQSILFMVTGYLIEIIAAAMYYYLLPKQIITEQTK